MEDGTVAVAAVVSAGGDRNHAMKFDLYHLNDFLAFSVVDILVFVWAYLNPSFIWKKYERASFGICCH